MDNETQFRIKEGQFKNQLRFTKHRTRRIQPPHKKAGFYLAESAALYLKAKDEDLAQFNQNLLEKLGEALNAKRYLLRLLVSLS
jgi:hypothetical protein